MNEKKVYFVLGDKIDVEGLDYEFEDMDVLFGLLLRLFELVMVCEVDKLCFGVEKDLCIFGLGMICLIIFNNIRIIFFF